MFLPSLSFLGLSSPPYQTQFLPLVKRCLSLLRLLLAPPHRLPLLFFSLLLHSSSTLPFRFCFILYLLLFSFSLFLLCLFFFFFCLCSLFLFFFSLWYPSIYYCEQITRLIFRKLNLNSVDHHCLQWPVFRSLFWYRIVRVCLLSLFIELTWFSNGCLVLLKGFL